MLAVLQGGDNSNTLAIVDIENFVHTYGVKAIRVNQAGDPQFLVPDEDGVLGWVEVGDLEPPKGTVTPIRLS